jgi:RES domain-containing protein
MKLWRIAADTRQYRAGDLTGAGAARAPGRWNDVGEPVIYAALTISMAVLGAERIDASDIWSSVLPEGQLGGRPLAPADLRITPQPSHRGKQ